ncbi:uncharacterized protein LOC115566130 [Sparus aurata]|uniref:uncharacterized protein LOC115566130 n=1 Tax=Sparus aurata TaxID=8175 RepID=UPI0011C0E695|nr:uncharacterized protein LOC115566130 [Sparus aurata]
MYSCRSKHLYSGSSLKAGVLSLTMNNPTDRDREPNACTVCNREEDILTEKQVELEVTVCQEEVEVEEGEESVQLPFITTPDLPKRATVMWAHGLPSYRIVHKYKNRSDRPKERDQEYKDRTEVKKDLLKTGDLSLTLKYPKEETDTGTYWFGVIKDRKILREKIVKLKVKGRIQINDETVDIRNRSRSTDPTPLMADRSVRSLCEGEVSGSLLPAAVRLYSQRCSQ